MCELSLSRVSTFLQSLLLKQLGLGSSLVKETFSRKIPLTMSMTRDTCWRNDTRYGCGLTMASFSQTEVLRETSVIESNLSLFLFFYLKLLEISTINIFPCTNTRTQREYRVNLNSPSTLSDELQFWNEQHARIIYKLQKMIHIHPLKTKISVKWISVNETIFVCKISSGTTIYLAENVSMSSASFT